ncbi:MAG: hypothetical protein II710_01870 [Clostridia bacterium]|nr:hypothetical protein [Clostridia bacterium]MBQ3927375.1 hypothetical protein [Clostridia bacterium]
MATRYEDDENIIARAFGYYLEGEGTQNKIPATLQLTINGLYLFDRRYAENKNGHMYAKLIIHLSWQDFEIIGEGKLGERRRVFVPYKDNLPLYTFISDTVSYRDMTQMIKDLKNIGIAFL